MATIQSLCAQYFDNAGNYCVPTENDARVALMYLACQGVTNNFASKEYVDAAIQGISWKEAAVVATQSNLNLAAPGATIDGITLAVGDRVLVRNQTAPAQNGIYIWNGAAVPMTRSVDGNTTAELEQAVISVEEGTDTGKTFRQSAINFLLESGSVTFVSFGATSTPAGSNTQVQFNNSGAFGADSNFVWDNTNKWLGVGITPTSTFQVNSTSGAVYPILFGSTGVTPLGGMYVSSTNTFVAYGSRNNAQVGLFVNNGNPVVAVKTSGQVVMATGAQAITSLARLHVEDDAASDLGVALFKNPNTGAGGLLFDLSKGTDAGLVRACCIRLQSAGVDKWAVGLPRRGGSTNSGSFVISQNYDIGAGGGEFIISTTGNVSVGGNHALKDLARLSAVGSDAAKQVAILRMAASQTANAFEIQDSAAGIMLAIGANGRDFKWDTTTGSKLGTTTSQKMAFWNKTPIIQPTTGITAVAFTANTSLIANDTATFGGYTIGQVVAALVNVGLLA